MSGGTTKNTFSAFYENVFYFDFDFDLNLNCYYSRPWLVVICFRIILKICLG